jgi:2TM domain
MELTMETDNLFEKKQQEMATKRVKRIKSFYIHSAIYVFVLLIYIAKEYFNAPIRIWPFNMIRDWIIQIWTCVFVLDVLDFFIKEKLFGSKWEQKKLNHIIEEEKSRNKI